MVLCNFLLFCCLKSQVQFVPLLVYLGATNDIVSVPVHNLLSMKLPSKSTLEASRLFGVLRWHRIKKNYLGISEDDFVHTGVPTGQFFLNQTFLIDMKFDSEL